MFRLLAVALSLVPLILAELACIAFGWGRPAELEDPFVGFSDIHPLFVLNEDETLFVRAPSRKNFFAEEQFPARKPEGTFRIFCFGGSTVQGRPYSIPTSFPTWLEIALDTSDPSRDWEVVNCGGVSYASYRLVPIMEECLNYEPDLYIVCTGHNEFLEDRTYEQFKRPSRSTQVAMNVLGRSRVFLLLREAFRDDDEPEPPPPAQELSAEVDAILDYNDSLKLYHRDDEWRNGVVEHFALNLRRMVQLCRRAEVPLIFIRPPSNLADTPPFKTEPSESLSPEGADEFQTLFEAARENYRDDLPEACRLLEQAVKIDPRHALAWYELGQCRLTLNRTAQAREAFWKARDEDICPLRMISPLEETLQSIAAEAEIPLLDAFALLEAMCQSGILDDEKLVDHVHPSFTGNQQIGLALAELMQELGFATFEGDWRPRSQSEFQKHFRSLDDLYFHNGLETLEALQGWAQGRAMAPDAGERFPHLLDRDRSAEKSSETTQ